MSHCATSAQWDLIRDGNDLLPGIFGAGKTSLISIIIDGVLKSSRGRLAIFTAPLMSTSGRERTILDTMLNIFLGILRHCAILSNVRVLDLRLIDQEAVLRVNIRRDKI